MKCKLKYFLTSFTCISLLYLLTGCPHGNKIKEYLQRAGIQTIHYDNNEYLHVHFSGQTQDGDQWIVREVQEQDEEQLATLLIDPNIMPRIDSWIEDFKRGRVNNTLVIYDPNESKLIGAIVVGSGNGIAGTLDFEIRLVQSYPESYRTSVLDAFVNQFAREIYQLTHPKEQSNVANRVAKKLAEGFPGVSLDSGADLFSAFSLDTLYTISDDPAPMYREAGFIAARFGPGATTLEKLYDNNGSEYFTDIDALKMCLQQAYSRSGKTADQKHYQLKLNGQDVTVSYQGDMVRYHWAYSEFHLPH